MIDWLEYSKSAYFYKRSPHRLTKKAIGSAFKALRNDSNKPSRNVFFHLRRKLDQAVWSAISFFHERQPSFLDLPADHTRELVCGFLLIVEYRDHIAIFKAGLDLPSSFMRRHMRVVGGDRIESATARANAIFEQIRLRNMANSRHVMRSKTLEASDLRTVVSPAGAGRYVPSAFRTREADAHYAATPSTGRISMRSDRLGYEQLISWAAGVVDRLQEADTPLSPFINTFARRLSLRELPRHLRPIAFALDAAALTERLVDEFAKARLVRQDGNQWIPLSHAEAAQVIEALSSTYTVRRQKGRHNLKQNGRTIGSIYVGKTRISLRQFYPNEGADLFVEPTEPDTPGATREPLRRYIDRESLFTVLFSDIDVVYMQGDLFKDPSLYDGGTNFLAYLNTSLILNTTISEKGTFSAAHTAFDTNSVFGAIVEHLSADQVLACDDLGDEWADFIGLSDGPQGSSVTFYHAKHGIPSLGASSFHVSVSQALKNLSNLRMTIDSIGPKQLLWESLYKNDGSETQIRRMVRGDFPTLRQMVEDSVTSPDTIRRVLIVTDSLSKQQVSETLTAAKNGTQPPPHFIQLYTLLMTLFSTCAEMGASCRVVCRCRPQLSQPDRSWPSRSIHARANEYS